jgi:hypothetical protein
MHLTKDAAFTLWRRHFLPPQSHRLSMQPLIGDHQTQEVTIK